MVKENQSGGFTLIELSIVLVIIGLIVGGVLVGQDLITAAAVRAQITQIEKFNTAANTFFGKYGYLPGDIPAGPAAQFGFAPRGQYAGEGDGDGIIEGAFYDTADSNSGAWEGQGETVMFWSDLSAAHLIAGNFTTASSTGYTCYTPTIPQCFPAAKIGRGNFIYVYSYAYSNVAVPDQVAILYSNGVVAGGGDGGNYFGLSIITANSWIASTPGLTVLEASSIDSKIDDGLPLTGRVKAIYLNVIDSTLAEAAAGGGVAGAAAGTETPGSQTTCYDNGGIASNTMRYSVEITNGSGINCALSFHMQGAGR